MSKRRLLQGKCLMCLRPHGVRPLSRHHLFPKRRKHRVDFNINDPRNIVLLCRPCHNLVESDLAARKMLRRVMSQDHVDFLRRNVGSDWLESHYPYPGGDARRDKLKQEIVYVPRRRQHARRARVVHLDGCDPYWGCKNGCPVAVKAGTYYPMVQ